jgi:hypothetical protein
MMIRRVNCITDIWETIFVTFCIVAFGSAASLMSLSAVRSSEGRLRFSICQKCGQNSVRRIHILVFPKQGMSRQRDLELCDEGFRLDAIEVSNSNNQHLAISAGEPQVKPVEDVTS